MQVLQGKLRRAERVLQQREVRIAELQARCRQLDKEHHHKKTGGAKAPQQVCTSGLVSKLDDREYVFYVLPD